MIKMQQDELRKLEEMEREKKRIELEEQKRIKRENEERTKLEKEKEEQRKKMLNSLPLEPLGIIIIIQKMMVIPQKLSLDTQI